MEASTALKWLTATAAAGVLAMGLAGEASAQKAKGNQFTEESDSGGSGAAAAQLITGSSFDLMIASFERNDLHVELNEDSDGDPLLKSTDKDNPFSVHFYGCTDHKDCGFIQFTSGWNLKDGITLAKIEEWNSTKVWGQAYRDEDKDPWLAMAVNLFGGVSVENFDDTVDWWKVILGQFEKHIEWDKQ
jgi:hypothetical protein